MWKSSINSKRTTPRINATRAKAFRKSDLRRFATQSRTPDFDEPSHGDPVGVEANGDGDGDEAEGDREMEEIQNLGRAGSERARVHLAAQKNVDRGQAEREPRHVSLIDFLDHGVGLQEIDSRIDECQNRRDRGEAEAISPSG